MNFEFEINSLVPYEITKYDSDLRIIHPNHLRPESYAQQLSREMRNRLGAIIDRMGEASAKAQGLKDIITSNRKLSINYQHKLYLMKNASANNGKGAMVGMLKVGEKRLFVYDSRGENHEMMPLCVLDFYVVESEQRKGYGKSLFDCMLSMENTVPEYLAIDYPSEKSVKFLKKHYNLKNPSFQGNNYVIFEGFFKNRSGLNKRGNSMNQFAAPNTDKNTSNMSDTRLRTEPQPRYNPINGFDQGVKAKSAAPYPQTINKNIQSSPSGMTDMSQLLNNQQLIQNRTQQLKLEQQQSHLDFLNNNNSNTNSRINSTSSVYSSPSFINSNHSSANRNSDSRHTNLNLTNNNLSEFLRSDNSSLNGFKSNSILPSPSGLHKSNSMSAHDVRQMQQNRSNAQNNPVNMHSPFNFQLNRNEQFTQQMSNKPPLSYTPTLVQQQQRRDPINGNMTSNTNAINLREFGLSDTQVYNPYGMQKNERNLSIYANQNHVLDKYKKTKLW